MRLAVSVVTWRQAVTRSPVNGFSSLKPFPDEAQHRHGGFGPFDLEFALVCQLDISSHRIPLKTSS